MIVVVSAPGGDEPQISLRQPRHFAALTVLVEPEAEAHAAAALEALGRRDGAKHVWIAPGTLERLAGELGSEPEWRQSLSAMLAFATGHGWVDEGGAVRAHVEQRGAG